MKSSKGKNSLYGGKDHPSIAIVGAGFAGLVLANYLEHQDYFRYTVFESKEASGIPIIGTIRLKSAQSILKELGLFDEACQSSVFPDHSIQKYETVSREDFLNLLRRRVKVRSSHRVLDVAIGNDGVTLATEEPSVLQMSSQGPFDGVVLSYGLLVRSKPIVRGSSPWVVAIGDCRPKKWWEWDILGVYRRTQGADSAILEAQAFAKTLASKEAWACETNAVTNYGSFLIIFLSMLVAWYLTTQG